MTDYKTAAAYIRVSTDDQVELSPASQLVEIRKWAAANGYLSPTNMFLWTRPNPAGKSQAVMTSAV